MRIEDILTMGILWAHESRKIDDPLENHDQTRRTRQMNDRLQLLFEGNHLNASQRYANVRLQFLGVKITDPPNRHAAREVQIHEQRRSHGTRHLRDDDLALNDN